MRNVFKIIILTIKDEEGASVVEYAILITLISALIIASVGSLGKSTHDAFNTFNDEWSNLVAMEERDKCGDKDSKDDLDCGIGND